MKFSKITDEQIEELNSNIVQFFESCDIDVFVKDHCEQAKHLTNLTISINPIYLKTSAQFLEAAGRDGFKVVGTGLIDHIIVLMERSREYIETELFQIKYKIS